MSQNEADEQDCDTDDEAEDGSQAKDATSTDHAPKSVTEHARPQRTQSNHDGERDDAEGDHDGHDGDHDGHDDGHDGDHDDGGGEGDD